MIIIEPSFEVLTEISDGGIKELQKIEQAARVCYKSEGYITEDGESAKKIVSALIKSGHEAMIEHSQLTVKFICDRGVTHELVRHRLFSFAQESQRYCNYSKDKFDANVTFISPCFWNDDGDHSKRFYNMWAEQCEKAEQAYFDLLNCGATPQEARTVLPNSTKTEIVVTGNYREWRAFFKLRVDKAAHPQMRELTIPLLKYLQERIPVVFDDIKVT